MPQRPEQDPTAYLPSRGFRARPGGAYEAQDLALPDLERERRPGAARRGRRPLTASPVGFRVVDKDGGKVIEPGRER